ncbi:ArsR/SmtB family transcription factor [Rhodohalobacter mucosus]|uniref:ArsR family transcriptional regulator n=1 Tax=Rhodohalobacter mucosus TaxID=2079485 RepID=A0A316TXH9_9BACT|nr:metalloregulator ArsR/SmtB family transcription factor [Rhodohalobacter mucosus]PWN08005.1 ArsR family transcriptional regulator [Rhodohalobacter mucosus]
MDTRKLKTNLYKQLASVTKALSNPHRLEIIDLLAQGAFPVEYIAEQTNMPVANASQHLQVLKNSGLVTTNREGKYIYYELAGQHVYNTWCSLRELGFMQNSEIRKLLSDYRERRNQLHTISDQELISRVEKGDIYIIDVRPEKEYTKGHIKSAVSIPNRTLRERVSEMPKDREIVAYCRGPLCLMADEAVSYLRKKGYRAWKLDDGYSGWVAGKRPVAYES